MKKYTGALLVVVVFTAWVSADNWPAWRGPLGIGVSGETGLPVEWSQEKNIRWKTRLPAPGNSTPIIWNDRIFLSGALEEGAVRTLMCFDRKNGKEVWRQEVRYEGDEPTHKTNPYCSSSPVTDGERVIVWHGSAGMFAYDLSGKLLWKKDLGEFQHIWGNASSPVLHENLVFLNAGPGLSTFLAAFDKTSGEEVWRVTPEEATSEKLEEFRGSWSTPVLHKVGGKLQLIVSLPNYLAGFEPATGEEIWRCRGLSKLAYTSPLVKDNIAVAMSGYHGPALATKIDGTGDITETHRLWLHDAKNPQRIGSGVIVGDFLYILNEPGIAWCIELESGDVRWKERLEGGRSWSSMVRAEGRLYVTNMQGNTLVLEPNPDECKVIAENPLGELTRASLAISDGQIFIRTYEHLYCIDERN